MKASLPGRSLSLVISSGLASLLGVGSIWVPNLLPMIFPMASLTALEGIRLSVGRFELGRDSRTKSPRTFALLGVFAASATAVVLAAEQLGPFRGPLLGLAALLWIVPVGNEGSK